MNNKIVRNESAETVPRQPTTLLLLIYHLEQQLLRLTMKSTDSVGDLIDEVRHKLARKFQNIIGLASKQGYFTLDYALQTPQCKLAGIRNNQRLQLLFQDIVADPAGPTLPDFTFLACLGEGISASVFLVRHGASGRLFAMKQIKKEYFREFKTLESVLREKKILSEMVVDLPFVTKLQAAFESEGHLNFLLQFYPGGQFFFHLTQRKLTEDDAKLCFAQVLVTMEQLHQRKILYRDLKPENIMVDFEGHLRLGDFGLCRINLEREEFAHSHCGSPEYMAFETKDSEGYGYPADFYTMGAIIYEMVKGIPPFFKGEPPNYDGTSSGFRDLVQALIRQDPTQRLSNFQQIKRSKWLHGINWQKLLNRQYRMPTMLHFYINYIHNEFIQKQFDWQELRNEGKYDRLFEMFFYMSDRPDSIGMWYPNAKKGKKGSNIKKKSKDNSTHSQRGKSKSRHSSQSSSSSKSKDKAKNEFFKKKPTKEPNLYTGAAGNEPRAKHMQRSRNEISYKSSSKGKDVLPKNHFANIKDVKQSFFNSGLKKETIGTIGRSKSPLRFNIVSAKSVGALKGLQYKKELDRSASKRKKL